MIFHLPVTSRLIPSLLNWHAHGHAGNPSFTTVILHVIWNGPAKTALPTLRLQPYLNAPIKDLADWHGTQPPFPLEFTGQCRALLATISTETQNDLFFQAAFIRLQAKADTFTHLARLLGCADLLTNDLPNQTPAARRHLRQLWDCWWRERGTLGKHQLTSSLWHFSDLRPANHPLRRLALLAHWLAWGNLPPRCLPPTRPSSNHPGLPRLRPRHLRGLSLSRPRAKLPFLT